MAIENDARLHFETGESLYQQGKYSEACHEYEQAIVLHPDYVAAYNSWGNALFNLKEYEQAIEKYQEAIKLDPKYVTAYSNCGLAYYNLKQYQEAIEQYKKAVVVDPQYVDAYHNCGLAFYRLNQYQEAIEQYQKAIEVDPQYVDAYLEYGNTLAELYRYDEALNIYEKAIKIDPDYAYAYHNIADYFWQQGKYKKAREKWDEAIKAYQRAQPTARKENNANHFLYYGSVFYEIFYDFKKAEKLYTEGLQIEPNNIDLMIALVELYIKEQDLSGKSPVVWGQVRQNYKMALNLLELELDDATTWLKKGKLYLVMKEYKKAEECFTQALQLDDSLVEVHSSLGVVHVRQEDFKEGVECFKKALNINRDHLTARNNLAEAYLKLERFEEALREYKSIIETTDGHVEAHIGLGETYKAIGDSGDTDIYISAIEHFNEAIKIAQSGKGSKTLRQKELAAVLYSRGYARIKLYENSSFIPNENLLSRALEDFRSCIQNAPEHYKGKRALEKIKNRFSPTQRQSQLLAMIGSLIVSLASLFIFGMVQSSFWFGIPTLNKVSSNTAPTPSSQPEQNVNQGQASSPVQKTVVTPEHPLTQINSIDTTRYFLLTFDSLTFIIIGVYLPQLLKLKVGGSGIEIEKSSIDQIKVSGPLGITK